jgi:hypothetical protein
LNESDNRLLLIKFEQDSKQNFIMNTQNIQLNIPLNFEQVIDIVRQLSPSEKKQLSDLLLSDQNNDDLNISDEQKQVVRDRIKKYEDSPGSYLSWNDIEHKIVGRK